MKKLMILAIAVVLASSTGCNFCKRFCGGPAAPQPVVAQPMMYSTSCQPIEGCSPSTCGPSTTVLGAGG
jgi:hypothetical protein